MDTLLATLLPLLAGGFIFFLAVAVYQTFFEKSMRAQNRVDDQLSAEARKRRALLKAPTPEEKSILKNTKDTSEKMARLQVKIEQANWQVQPQEFRLMAVGCALITGIIVGLISGNILLGLLAPVGGYWIPYGVLHVRVMLRMAKAEEQFAGVLDSMVSCLKSGFGFNQAVNSITENYDDPWGTEFGKMSVETTMGIEQSEMLNNMRRRIPNDDVDLFVTAMKIYGETGGNLVELLTNLSNTIRIRYKLLRKVRTLSAQGKLSAGIVSCVPLFILVFMNFITPEAVGEFVKHPIGLIILSLVGIWMAFGVGVLFNIVQIEV